MPDGLGNGVTWNANSLHQVCQLAKVVQLQGILLADIVWQLGAERFFPLKQLANQVLKLLIHFARGASFNEACGKSVQSGSPPTWLDIDDADIKVAHLEAQRVAKDRHGSFCRTERTQCANVCKCSHIAHVDDATIVVAQKRHKLVRQQYVRKCIRVNELFETLFRCSFPWQELDFSGIIDQGCKDGILALINLSFQIVFNILKDVVTIVFVGDVLNVSRR